MISQLKAASREIETSLALSSGIDGTLRQDQLRRIKNDIETSLDQFEKAYRSLVESSSVDEVQLILDRNGELFLKAEGSYALFGTLRESVISALTEITHNDNLVLSQRIWRIKEDAKIDIQRRVQRGILLGESHVKVAKDIMQYVERGRLRFNSERLVKTEMAKAYKLANELSVEKMRSIGASMWFEKWELSDRHPRPDVCGREGTLINTKNGYKNIEDIKIGDEVLTHKGRYRKVTKLYRTPLQNAELRKLTFQSERNRTHEVIVTPNHPFLIEGEWIPAGELKKGQCGVALPESLCEQDNQFLSGNVYKGR